MSKCIKFLPLLWALLALACGGQAAEVSTDSAPVANVPVHEAAKARRSSIPGSENYVDPATYHGPEHVVLSIWVESHPDLDGDEMVRGCNWWNPKGLECFLATDKALADIIVTADERECVWDEDGSTPVARGWPENGRGNIVVNVNCLNRDDLGNPEVNLMAQLGAHEGGHTLGLLHVPWECDGSDPKNPVLIHPNGTPICGRMAVMNPAIYYTLTDISELDKLVFDVRMPGGLYPTGTEDEQAGAASASPELPSDECVFVIHRS